jgi:hypothetical protein
MTVPFDKLSCNRTVHRLGYQKSASISHVYQLTKTQAQNLYDNKLPHKIMASVR